MTSRLRSVLVVLALTTGACGTSTVSESAAPSVVPADVATPTSTPLASATSPPTTVKPPEVPATAIPATAPPTTASTTTASPTVVPPTAAPSTTVAAGAVYAGAVLEIDASLAEAMTPTSFREACPVTLDELRLVEITYLNYDGEVRPGQVIVHRDHAAGIAQVFEELFEAGFPMQSVDLVDVHGGSDQASMQANNTSAFNCREVAYRPGVWSNHALGTAIDINPLVNPYVKGDFVDPEAGRRFADRTGDAPGMIFDGDVVVQAFERIGWSWGGYWNSAKDYQHFSASGS